LKVLTGLTEWCIENQDNFAVWSQNKAEIAKNNGKFSDEIVPILVPQKKGDPIVFATDEFIREGTTIDAISKLKPAFKKRKWYSDCR
jgi:acetyl-CoA C-acetyltransferase